MASITRRLVKTINPEERHLKFLVKEGRQHVCEVVTWIILRLEFWTKEKKVWRNHPFHKKLNSHIDRMELLVKVKVIELVKDDLITKTSISTILKNVVLNCGIPDEMNVDLPQYTENYTSFFEFAEVFIMEAQARKTKGTIKTYRQAINRLKEYKKSIDFEDIDLKFYYGFISFLSRKKINNNTAGKHVKVLKTILNEATEQGLNKNLEFRKRKFKVFREESDSVYLNLDEIEELTCFREKLTEAKRKVLDLFLVGCHTGLRFSDLSSLSKANIYTDSTGIYILQRNIKTNQQVVIPVNSKAAAILNHYSGQLPKAISNQKTNKALKAICQAAEFDKEVETKTKIGGETITKVWKKYELISTHTARRSFATNAFLAGVPVLAIMKITGHKTEKAFMQYIKATQLENAIVLAQHPFFK